MHHRRIWPLALLTLVMSGCGPVATTVRGTYIYFGGSTAPRTTEPTLPAAIGVFTTDMPTRSFFEIGIIEALGSGTLVQEADLTLELLWQAAKMGADAIYRLDVQRFDESGAALYATAVAVRYY